MRDKVIVAKKYIDKQELIDVIEKLGKKYNYTINKDPSELYSLDDIDLIKDISDDEVYLIGFWVKDELEFKDDTYEINGENYNICISTSYHSEVEKEMIELIHEILKRYPDMYATDDGCKEFFSLDDFANKQLPSWFTDA